MSPFARLALFAGCALVAGVIAAVAIYLDGWVALFAVLGGAVLASLATLTLERTPKAEAPAEPGEPIPSLRIRTRDAIARSADRARAEDAEE